MIEVMRWVALGVSLFSMCFSIWTFWFVSRVNGRLREENWDLRTKCLVAEREIIRLRNLLERENSNETDAH